MSFIEIQNLVKVYKGNKKAVDNVSLVIEEGKIYGLLGPNGAGKSTLISLILGLIPLSSGEVTVLQEPHQSIRKISSQIGYVPQDIAVYPDLTAYENVELFGSLYGMKGSNLKDQVLKSLDFVGLRSQANQFPSQFSGGMKRRLNIACALVHSPKLIIFDEPTVGIDPQSRNHILDSIRLLNQQGATVIYTSHYMEEVESLCDYIFIMDHGSIIEEGPKVELEKRYAEELNHQILVTLMEKPTSDLSKKPGWSIIDTDYDSILVVENSDITTVVRQLSEEGILFSEIKHNHLNLEEIFLHLTGKKLRD